MSKGSLGKGLSALLAGTQGADAAKEVMELPLESIASNPFQPRRQFDETTLQELAASIRENGVLQPVLVRRKGPDGYELIVGERRLRACRMLGLATIPAIVRECSDRDMLLMALIENVQRHDVNPVEQAMAYARMQSEFGFTHDEIARRVGKSRAAVTNTMRLLSLSDEVLRSLEDGRITEGHARLLVGMEPDAQRGMLDAIVSRGMSVREAEGMVRELKGSGGSDRSHGLPSSVERDPNLVALEEALSVALSTRVGIDFFDVDRGRIRVDFYSREQLEGLVERITGTEGWRAGS